MGGLRLGRAPVILLVTGFALGAFSLTFTHLAGSLGGPGFEDGVASDARFKSDAAIAVDSSGNLYVADSGNHTIRVVSSSTDVTTLAGLAETSGITDGRGAHALFKNPSGILVDGSGTVYVADTGNHTIARSCPECRARSSGIRDFRDTSMPREEPRDSTAREGWLSTVPETSMSRTTEITRSGWSRPVAS